MLTKKDVIEKMKSLNLPENAYIVYGSAPFAVLEIREVNDIDLLVSEELYRNLEKSGWKKIYKAPKDEPLTYDIFEAHNTWKFSPYAPTLSELLSRAFKVDGVSFAALEDVRKWKEASGRRRSLIILR